MTNKEKIQKLLSEKKWRISELSEELDISRQMIHRYLKKFLNEGKVRKIGTPPFVYYELMKDIPIINVSLQDKIRKFIDKNFLFIDADGSRYDGVKGFTYWCQRRNFDIQKKAQEYIEVFKRYQSFSKNGIINADFKIRESFNDTILDHLYYLDFYSIEIFGKTKLGQLLLYAKQSQNKKIINDVIDIVSERIHVFVEKKKYDAVAFVAPTVKRDVQFMSQLEKKLKLPLSIIHLKKIQTEVVVPQKTLKKIDDRIKNADTTFAVSERRKFKKVLVIDDAVGSGATIHQIAKKIKDQGVAQQVDGLAIVGSVNGFDVLSEV